MTAATLTIEPIVVYAALLGLLAGALVVWLVSRPRAAADRQRLLESTDRVARLEAEHGALVGDRDQLRNHVADLRAAHATTTAELDAERRAAADKLAVLQAAEQRLREAFDALSHRALASNNQSFLDLARAQLGEFQQSARGDLDARQLAVDAMVAPLRESVAAVQQKLGEIEKERVGAYSALTEQLQALAAAERLLRAETANLGRALRSPSARGRWGEIQLQRVVELAGMVEHCDYVTQAHTPTEGGHLRPDLVVHLPGGKQLVVDAKAPLSAYLEALEAPDEHVREHKLAEHARQVRDHMKRLAAKAYQEQFPATPEFVVMFLPGEMFFGAALQQDPTLIEFGVEQRVIPASPTTLIALLRAVAYGWRQEVLADNARRISEEGAALYERLVTLAGNFGKMGTALRRAVEAHDATLGTLERRVLPTARRLRELGAAGEAALPELDRLELQPRALQATELGAAADDDATS